MTAHVETSLRAGIPEHIHCGMTCLGYCCVLELPDDIMLIDAIRMLQNKSILLNGLRGCLAHGCKICKNCAAKANSL